MPALFFFIIFDVYDVNSQFTTNYFFFISQRKQNENNKLLRIFFRYFLSVMWEILSNIYLNKNAIVSQIMI